MGVDWFRVNARLERRRRSIRSGECRGGNRRSNRALNIEQVLSAARARLRRLSPDEAHEAVVKTEAILVDIRPESQRAIEGSIAGALVVERNVLEWRFDPASSTRLPVATDHDLQVIVFCSEGYTSSLAATALQDLGLWRATDMVGGFQAWRATGLPIVPPTSTSWRGSPKSCTPGAPQGHLFALHPFSGASRCY